MMKYTATCWQHATFILAALHDIWVKTSAWRHYIRMHIRLASSAKSSASSALKVLWPEALATAGQRFGEACVISIHYQSFFLEPAAGSWKWHCHTCIPGGMMGSQCAPGGRPLGGNPASGPYPGPPGKPRKIPGPPSGRKPPGGPLNSGSPGPTCMPPPRRPGSPPGKGPPGWGAPDGNPPGPTAGPGGCTGGCRSSVPMLGT